MSKFIEIKKRLEQRSDFFCPAKWTELYLYLNHGNSNSCHHPIPHEIPKELLTDPFVLHNTPHKLAMQTMMMEGKRPDECHMCWHIEDADENAVSDRMVKSIDWQQHIDTLIPDPHYIPRFIEVVFDNLCNLNCSYCDPGQSSSWGTKIQTQPISLESDYRELYSKIHIRSGDTKPEYLRAWLDWWPQIKDQIKILKISGGEPLISPNFWKFFEILGNSPQLKFSINSNFSVDNNSVKRLISKSSHFKSIKVAASIDGQGSKAEYVRKGLDYKLFLENIRTWCEDAPENCTLNLQSTINILSVWSFAEFIELAANLRKTYPKKIVTFYSTVVRFPEFQSINLLPDYLKISLFDQIKDRADQCGMHLNSTEMVYVDKILGYLKTDPKPLTNLDKKVLYKDLIKFLDHYDRYGNNRLDDIFPDEFVGWLDGIRNTYYNS